jgi:hypothetical protein
MSYGAVGAGGVGAAGTKAKLYALFLVEAVKAEGVVVCFHRIGKGATACVKENLLDKSWKGGGLKAGHWNVAHFEVTYYNLH